MLQRLGWFLPRPWREVNKRGQMLVVFGFIWAAIGWNVLHTPDPVGWENLPIINNMSREVRAIAWMVSGVTAAAFAWRPRTIAHDGFGFLALYLMPAERVVIFLLGWIDYHTPAVSIFGWEWATIFDGPGYARGAYNATVWLAILMAVVVAATWDNPPHDLGPRQPTPTDEDDES